MYLFLHILFFNHCFYRFWHLRRATSNLLMFSPHTFFLSLQVFFYKEISLFFLKQILKKKSFENSFFLLKKTFFRWKIKQLYRKFYVMKILIFCGHKNFYPEKFRLQVENIYIFSEYSWPRIGHPVLPCTFGKIFFCWGDVFFFFYFNLLRNT